MAQRTIVTVAALAAVLWSNAATAALPPSQKCQAGKNQTAGKLAYCLSRAQANLIKSPGHCSVTTEFPCFHDSVCPMNETCAKDTSRYDDAIAACTAKFQEIWAVLESNAADAGDPCPTNGDETGIQGDAESFIARLEDDTDGIQEVKRVFVSSASPQGNMGGVAGADEICQDEADAAAVGGVWRAWLSTTQIDAKDRINEGEYRLFNDVTVADDRLDLADGTLDTPIGTDVYGQSVGTLGVWTGTTALGVSSGTNCANWTSTSGNEFIGGTDQQDSDWTMSVASPCTTANHLYCFEQ